MLGLSSYIQRNKAITFTKESTVPDSLNGIRFTSTKFSNWKSGTMTLDEKPLERISGMSVGSGVIIEEKDGRFWLAHPANGYGGVRATFPKGTLEPHLTLQENAIKEAFEESGLIVRITGLVGDVVRTTSVARFYKAVRVGGNPTQFHWETEAVSLVPKNQLKNYLNQAPDFKLLAMI